MGVIAVAVASARLTTKRNKTFCINPFLVIIRGKRTPAALPKGIRGGVRLKSELSQGNYNWGYRDSPETVRGVSDPGRSPGSVTAIP